MFAASLLVGLSSAQYTVSKFPTLAVVGMLLALVGTYLTREPILTLARRYTRLSTRARRYAIGLLACSSLLIAGGGVLVLTRVSIVQLLPIAAVGLPLYILVLYAAVRGEAWRWWADVSGVILAALAAPAMSLAVSGNLGFYEWQVFSLCLVFFLGSMFHLRVLLRDQRGIRRRKKMHPEHAIPWTLASVVAAVLLAWVGWFASGWVLAVASAALLRSVFIRGRVLDRHMRIGLSEAAINVLFVSAILFV